MSRALLRAALPLLLAAASPTSAAEIPRTPIPALTDADRAAAIAPAGAHEMHASGLQSLVLLDRLESWHADGVDGAAWDTQAWIGSDRHRLWLRSEGERRDGDTEHGDIELLYGRPLAPWWDLLAGVRHDLGGAGRDWAALGVSGMTPYKFELDATLYVGASGRSEIRAAVEYETLFSDRLILQSALEATLASHDDPARSLGSGLTTIEAGLRLRYEFNRRFAPYVGVVYDRAFAGTADLRRADVDDVDGCRFVAGVRLWF